MNGCVRDKVKNNHLKSMNEAVYPGMARWDVIRAFRLVERWLVGVGGRF
ncbi:unnamed protein product [Wuchereria bancrofti]|uniref:Uncharacterized protein n=1 Tax=Wuchereria bancrofti TaxID=6293 RepID=A0A3P7DUZ5_WUCBA|nr:unnamed protein product [Wuchereria bancrofti]